MQSRGQERYGIDARKKSGSGRVKCWAAVCAILLAAVVVPASRGQRAEKCSESLVKKKSEAPVTQSAAEDIYANTANSKGPVKGKAQVEALRAATLAERKNSKPAVYVPDKIVTSRTGDMAYDYGKVHVEYDLASTGQHIAYDIEYMRVWKVNGGICQVEGIFSRPDKLSGINK